MGSYFSQEYLPESECNSATEDRTRLLRFRSLGLWPLHHEVTCDLGGQKREDESTEGKWKEVTDEKKEYGKWVVV